MSRFAAVILLALAWIAGVHAYGAETPVIDPAKAAQLVRLEPLTADKVDVFVEAGQLTREQADYVKKHIGPGGRLALPSAAIGPEQAKPRAVAPRAAERAARPTPPRAPSAPANDPYEAYNYELSAQDRAHLARLVKDYRHGNRPEIGRELRKFRPAVNAVIASAYQDPIDLPIKIKLWEEVAGPANPDAAEGLFETHRAAYDFARPVLVPYYKDAGAIIVRRKRTGPDANEYPAERFISSRGFREMIIDAEGLIARCAGPNAAIFLMGIYSQRYTEGEAPMRDKGRDRLRMVEACGGNPEKFDQDEPETWHSTLSAAERAGIAEHLIPWLSRPEDDRRQIAKNGLMICLPHRHPDWKAGAGEWERWWNENKDALMAAR